ncbi:hypothetical protein EMCRGX_G032182 [Ephydatia muelleri]
MIYKAGTCMRQSAKGRNTYSDHSISCSGFRVKIHGNLCYHYKSFVGRDYKAWSQMALFIISPYIGEGERKVLLALSKVFRIAYCDFFDPTEANAWQQICIDFVHSVKVELLFVQAGICFNCNQQLIVCDDHNCRLQVFDANGAYVNMLGTSA